MQGQPIAKLNVPPAVLRYMQELELIVKQMPGVSPEDALVDAREYLLADFEALARSGEPPEEDAHYAWIVLHFGTPEQVARQYSSEVDPPPSQARPGIAPGWRICCKHCGRSSPLAATGAIRIGAFSYHKYILGYCGSCKRLRWCRVIKDLDKTNLTERLCCNQSAEELRHSMHMSVTKMAALIVGGVLAINVVTWVIILICWRVSGLF